MGLTQEDAAARAGIDYKRYQRVEAGEVNVTIRTVVRIAGALGTTFARLVADPPSSRRTS
jgi:transcriptional regulator with XRE-family HTH domain